MDHRLLSFECGSMSRFVISTSPKICVPSETILPTTCPHFDSESIQAYRAIHPIPVINKKILREWSRKRWYIGPSTSRTKPSLRSRLLAIQSGSPLEMQVPSGAVVSLSATRRFARLRGGGVLWAGLGQDREQVGLVPRATRRDERDPGHLRGLAGEGLPHVDDGDVVAPEVARDDPLAVGGERDAEGAGRGAGVVRADEDTGHLGVLGARDGF